MGSSSEVFFRMANVGASAAEDIRVVFDPSPVDYNGKPLADNSLFKSPLTLLLPGQELRHLFQLSFNFSKPDVPARFDVEVSYRAQHQRFVEKTIIDMAQYAEMTLPRPTKEESLAAIAKTLEAMQRALASGPRRTPSA